MIVPNIVNVATLVWIYWCHVIQVLLISMVTNAKQMDQNAVTVSHPVHSTMPSTRNIFLTTITAQVTTSVLIKMSIGFQANTLPVLMVILTRLWGVVLSMLLVISLAVNKMTAMKNLYARTLAPSLCVTRPVTRASLTVTK